MWFSAIVILSVKKCIQCFTIRADPFSKLGETICDVLRVMKCPFPLASHQIRGLDSEAMFPVFQWLVKTLYETRAEMSAHIRRCSEAHFKNYFQETRLQGEVVIDSVLLRIVYFIEVHVNVRVSLVILLL